eukprot:4501838-Amphidinium_carterae.1
MRLSCEDHIGISVIEARTERAAPLQQKKKIDMCCQHVCAHPNVMCVDHPLRPCATEYSNRKLQS